MAVLVISILIICLLIMVTDVIAFRKAELTVETENSVQARENASCHIRVRNRSQKSTCFTVLFRLSPIFSLIRIL